MHTSGGLTRVVRNMSQEKNGSENFFFDNPMLSRTKSSWKLPFVDFKILLLWYGGDDV